MEETKLPWRTADYVKVHLARPRAILDVVRYIRFLLREDHHLSDLEIAAIARVDEWDVEQVRRELGPFPKDVRCDGDAA
jgi:hypothetical protein